MPLSEIADCSVMKEHIVLPEKEQPSAYKVVMVEIKSAVNPTTSLVSEDVVKAEVNHKCTLKHCTYTIYTAHFRPKIDTFFIVKLVLEACVTWHRHKPLSI